jgi:hypothetical protein
MNDPLNHPFYEVVEQAQPWIDAGSKVYFKFTCEKCGARQTFDQPNIAYKSGSCEECGYVTNIEETGMGFLLIT